MLQEDADQFLKAIREREPMKEMTISGVTRMVRGRVFTHRERFQDSLDPPRSAQVEGNEHGQLPLGSLEFLVEWETESKEWVSWTELQRFLLIKRLPIDASAVSQLIEAIPGGHTSTYNFTHCQVYSQEDLRRRLQEAADGADGQLHDAIAIYSSFRDSGKPRFGAQYICIPLPVSAPRGTVRSTVSKLDDDVQYVVQVGRWFKLL